MSAKKPKIEYNFFKSNSDELLKKLGKNTLLNALDDMLLARHFDVRGEQAYRQRLVWGFYHAYIGQEAIQAAATYALGKDKNLWVTTYRCHMLALLLGMSPIEGMCELFGKKRGIAGGRGGSMHLYTENMHGGHGIVGGQWPYAAGLAFTLKYQEKQDEIAICFGGEGSVAQGTFHETLNLATLWELPLLLVIENNRFGMGTQVERAIANQPIAENMAKAYGLSSYTLDGMDFLACYGGFLEAKKEILTHSKPVIIECVTHRFRGHSISDAANYRTKEQLKEAMKDDSITRLRFLLEKENMLTEKEFIERDEIQKNKVVEALKVAEEEVSPDLLELEEGVMK